jgi:hypothetical protein
MKNQIFNEVCLETMSRMSDSSIDKNMNNIGKTFCEPIWVWSKGEAPEPKWNQDTYFGV